MQRPVNRELPGGLPVFLMPLPEAKALARVREHLHQKFWRALQGNFWPLAGCWRLCLSNKLTTQIMAADPGPAQGVGRNYVVWIARQDTLEARESDNPSALVDLGRFRLVQSVQADGQLTILPPIATLPLPPRATEEGMIPVCLFVLADMSKFQSLYEAFRAVALAPTWAVDPESPKWPLSTGLRHVALQRFLGLPCATPPLVQRALSKTLSDWQKTQMRLWG